MGTNYYLHKREPVCPTCGNHESPLHIGKSSVGWCFSLAVYPEDGISDLRDWLPLWIAPGAVIRDEYGQEVAPEAILDVIANRARPKPLDWSASDFTKNSAVPGPGNLARHRDALAHGEGTWDCLASGFC